MTYTQMLILLPVFLSINLYSGEVDLIKLDRLYANEIKTEGTIYLSREERKKYEVVINDFGEVINQEGTVLDTRNLPSGTAMFVYSKEGKIYVSTKKIINKFVHSSLVSGEDVIVAGTINIQRGYIKYMTDVSDRYVTKSSVNLKAVLHKLDALGVDAEDIRLFFQSNL